MTFTTNSSKKNTPPRVKWGSLIVSTLLVGLELALIALLFYANSGAMAGADIRIGFIAAYGWIIGLFGLVAAATLFFEKFLPSYIKYMDWKNYKNYKSKVAKATRESLVSNSKKAGRDYIELLEAMK